MKETFYTRERWGGRAPLLEAAVNYGRHRGALGSASQCWCMAGRQQPRADTLKGSCGLGATVTGSRSCRKRSEGAENLRMQVAPERARTLRGPVVVIRGRLMQGRSQVWLVSVARRSAHYQLAGFFALVSSEPRSNRVFEGINEKFRGRGAVNSPEEKCRNCEQEYTQD